MRDLSETGSSTGFITHWWIPLSPELVPANVLVIFFPGAAAEVSARDHDNDEDGPKEDGYQRGLEAASFQVVKQRSLKTTYYFSSSISDPYLDHFKASTVIHVILLAGKVHDSSGTWQLAELLALTKVQVRVGRCKKESAKSSWMLSWIEWMASKRKQWQLASV